MTDEEKLKMLRLMLESSEGEDSDEVLLAYLSSAAQTIVNRLYPYKDDVDIADIPKKYARKQVEIACYLLNKRGAEGEISHDENGIKRTYADADVPESMLKDIVPFCGVL